MVFEKFAPFDRRFFEADEDFTIIGDGGIGGKAHGLAAVRQLLGTDFDHKRFPAIEVAIPKLTVITTRFFDTFMAHNDLYATALSDISDDRMLHAFLKAELPADLVGDLWALVASVHTPLAVRSSSLLEDAKGLPFAGIYATKMIPNNQLDARTRFDLLTAAIKFVYASTFFKAAKDYLNATCHRPEDEKMAVIIQEVIGRRHDSRFYPHLSGVARSHNYYPFGHARPEDGIVNLALGLGRTIVDDGVSWAFSPRYPKTAPPFKDNRQLLNDTQTHFWAVNMGPPPEFDPLKEAEYLVRPHLAAAEDDNSLKYLASTYRAESDRVVSGIMASGARILNFAPILVHAALPLSALISELLELCQKRFGSAIEMEFAVTIAPDGELCRFGFLQARPMVVSSQTVTVADSQMSGEGVLLASENVLGNGCVDTIRDVVYVRPDNFDAACTGQIAAEIDAINRGFVANRSNYLLMGFGRWGSTDPWLGIPVTWGQISAAKVIVESCLAQMNVELSQGSHFFHNINGFQVIYISVRPPADGIDWQWLARQETVAETRFVRHVHLPAALAIRADGRTGRGVILK